ncbi:MAG: TlpA family protein disulfide reductase, partial [Bacteroidetes bacterium]|nr:TlpA family protein disulfide reductase [Bacteroidota bacterium]
NLEFYVDNGSTTITGTDKMATAIVSGGQTQRDFITYKAEIDPWTARMVAIMSKLGKAADEKNDSLRRVYSDQVKTTLPKVEAAKDSFVARHPDSYISLDLVRQVGYRPDVEHFERVYKLLTPRVLKSRIGRTVTGRLEIARNTTPGHPMNFTQNDTTGRPFTLASLKGKYVLVDFWASWCVPCRAENPNVVKAYQQLKDKNFEIVSISLDAGKGAWLAAIQKDGMPWIHVSDLKGWKNDLAVKFGINSVPQNFLIDPNGIILARNLRGEDLDKKLAKYMKL